VLRFLLRRIGATVLLVALVSMLTFSLLELAPDPAKARAGVEATPEQIEQTRREFGLDGSAVERYVRWVGDVAKGDLGESLQSRTPVRDIIADRIGVTVTVALSAFILSIGLGVGLGAVAALKAETRVDRAILAFSAACWSAPAFWIAMVLVGVFAIRFSWFPATGWTFFSEDPVGWLKGLVLPSVALALGGSSNIARVTRGSVLDVLQSDYIRSVRLKGLPPSRILFGHVLPNAMSPVITSATLLCIGLFNAAAIAEIVFALPGLGTQAFSAASFGDTPAVLGITMVAALFVAFVNLIGDMLQVLVNPRLRLT
jgi:peptide/nickel transport system permease protein